MTKKSRVASATSSPEARWQAEEDVRTLMRAEEIQKDRGRMARARKVAKEQAAEATKVANKLTRRSK